MTTCAECKQLAVNTITCDDGEMRCEACAYDTYWCVTCGRKMDDNDTEASCEVCRIALVSTRLIPTAWVINAGLYDKRME